MNALRVTRYAALLLLVLLPAALAAQTVERIAQPANGLSETIRHAVEERGYRVTLDNGWTADFWFAKELNLPPQDKSNPNALYPQLPASTFIGIVELHQNTPDYRGQAIRSGTYTLRYELLPQDGNHLGVAPNPDFLLVSPVTEDPNPMQPLALKKIVEMSSKTTGSHPAVIALENAAPPGTVVKTDNGSVFTIAIPAGSKTEKIGVCLTCSASQ